MEIFRGNSTSGELVRNKGGKMIVDICLNTRGGLFPDSGNSAEEQQKGLFSRGYSAKKPFTFKTITRMGGE